LKLKLKFEFEYWSGRGEGAGSIWFRIPSTCDLPGNNKTSKTQANLNNKPNIRNIIGRYLKVVLVKKESGAIAFWCGLGRKPCHATRLHDSPKPSTASRSFLIQTWKPANPNVEPDQLSSNEKASAGKMRRKF
jgi:hypothetical protein